MVRAVVAAFCLAASARGVSLGDGWEVEVGGDGALTGRRHGAVGLEALRLSFALGKASGGENTVLPNPIGFTMVSLDAQVTAPLRNVTLAATAGGAAASGRFCEDWRSATCRFFSCAAVEYWDAVNEGGCVDGVVAFAVEDGRLVTSVAVGGGATRTAAAEVVGRLTASTASEPSEMLVGFGNMPSALDVKNASFDVVSVENGIGRGDEPVSSLVDAASAGAAGTPYTTYAAVPLWLSSRGTVVLVDTTRVLRFESTADETQIGVLGACGGGGAVFKAVTLRHATPSPGAVPTWARLQREARALVGGPAPPLPAWTQEGLVAGVMGGSAAVRETLENLTAADVPVAAVWLQDWAGGTSGGRVLFDWQPDGCLYPDWHALVDELGARGVRVLSYASPFLTAGAVDDEPCRKDRVSMYDVARNRSFLVETADGAPLLTREEVASRTAQVDLSNPAAREWFSGILACQVLGVKDKCDPASPFPAPPANATAVAGYMADFGEHLPLVGAKIWGGGDPLEYHNQMPHDWATLTRRAAKINDTFVFHRSGSTKTPTVAGLFWAGDQEQSWQKNDGFPSVMRSYVSGGFAGWTQSTDIGGMVYCETSWLCKRTDELLGRWLELAAVLDPVMRSHPSNGNLDVPQPWSSPANLDRTRRATAIHAALGPSKRALVAAAAAGGPPMVRHTHFNCAVDSLASADFDALGGSQLMLGDDVLVAPVLAEGATEVAAVAPPTCSRGANAAASDTWLSIWDPAFSLKAGEHATLPAPLGQPCILVRNGSAVAPALLAAAAALGPAAYE